MNCAANGRIIPVWEPRELRPCRFSLAHLFPAEIPDGILALAVLDVRLAMGNMRESSRPTALEEYPLVVELPVQWGDVDAYGHVNNLAYLRWFETARAEYAMRVGVSVTPEREGVGAALAAISCKFLRQMSFPGTVVAGVRVTRMSIGSITLECRIIDGQTGVPVAQGGCDAVIYDYAADKPVPIPEHIRAAVEKLEEKSFPM